MRIWYATDLYLHVPSKTRVTSQQLPWKTGFIYLSRMIISKQIRSGVIHPHAARSIDIRHEPSQARARYAAR